MCVRLVSRVPTASWWFLACADRLVPNLCTDAVNPNTALGCERIGPPGRGMPGIILTKNIYSHSVRTRRALSPLGDDPPTLPVEIRWQETLQLLRG